MSASRTFTALSAFINGSKFGYQSAEKIRQALDIAMYLPTLDLGGEEGTGVVTGAATWVPVPGYRAFTLNGDSVGGLTVEAVVYYKTENSGQAVQVRLRNTTDSSTAATGTSSTATTATEEVLSVTLASGAKSYRLEMTGGATYACAAWGYLRLRVVPS